MVESFKPLQDNVLVKRMPCEKRTESGLLLSQPKESSVILGYVLSVGSKVVHISPDDRIFFDKKVGISIDEDLLILKEKDILGIY